MSENKDGGPAFPLTGLRAEYEGMSLRDYFAARAMHAELVTAGALEGPRDALVEAAEEAGQTVEQRIAFNAYRLADAMLKAREQAQTGERD